ncbi:class I glutamine amidotransferase-like protein [Polyplosphaeria fusca]|uniref:Class I glutamine amidotransferase-like protein n=1 Tax=Polyplosphaeria fusca TaxID=682080 RepID=A0A9P4QGW4_9PLEO|nr:class I glutamine amidotransferase-like protein [Polyplosphaeria fusca]
MAIKGVSTISSHPDRVRMLVLETDEPHPDTKHEKGSFGDILNELFRKAGENHNPKLGIETVIQYAVEDNGGKVPEPEDIGHDIHAILITGSKYDAHSDVRWVLKLIRFIRQIWIDRPDIRFAGICFGHQILCRTLGSEVRPSKDGNWELSHTPVALTDTGRSLFNLKPSDKHIHLHQMHLDYVVSTPSPERSDLLNAGTQVHVWGTSEHTGIQGVYIQKRLFSTQGHMEFDEKMVRRQLELRVNAGTLKEYDADEATERADWIHDGLLVSQAVLRFFHGDDDKIA